MSGCKLALYAPLIDTQIKSCVKSQDENMVSVILCSSQQRISEIREFLAELTAFTSSVIQVVSVDSNTGKEDVLEGFNSGSEELKSRNKVFLITPGDFTRLQAVFNPENLSFHWVVIDKVDVHLALDLKEDLISIAEQLAQKSKKLVITTNIKDKLDEESTEIRQAFTKGAKALVIRLNDEIRTQTAFERMDHMYLKCKNIDEKYLGLFSFLKLGVIQGKSLIYVNDIVTAYRLKLFLNKF
jgi:ATP-dependent RNA helicase DDX56/DBP9